MDHIDAYDQFAIVVAIEEFDEFNVFKRSEKLERKKSVYWCKAVNKYFYVFYQLFFPIFKLSLQMKLADIKNLDLTYDDKTYV